MAPSPAQVSVIAPIQPAVERARRLLFQPFDLSGGRLFPSRAVQVPDFSGGHGGVGSWEQGRTWVVENLELLLESLDFRSGLCASRVTDKDGTVMEKSKKDAGPDLRTFCAGFAQVCCANGRVVHACVGAKGCDFGDDSACN